LEVSLTVTVPLHNLEVSLTVTVNWHILKIWEFCSPSLP